MGGGLPAAVKRTGGSHEAGLLRIDFPGYGDDELERISWDDFFQKFDERGLALLQGLSKKPGTSPQFAATLSGYESRLRAKLAPNCHFPIVARAGSFQDPKMGLCGYQGFG